MAAEPAPAPLAPEEGARLTEFARACKAAARAVTLYPDGHPAIAATLGRIVSVTSEAALPAPLNVTVLPDALLLEGRPLAKPDPAVGELAILLHSHLIGQLLIKPGGDTQAWRSFLLLLGRAPEAVRTEGGIARAWTTMAGRHVEVREIDYAEVLRERGGGEKATWDLLITRCLEGGGSSIPLDDQTVGQLLAAAGASDALSKLVEELERTAESAGTGVGVKTAALLRLLRGIVETVVKRDPSLLEPALQNMAMAVAQLTPDTLSALLSLRDEGRAPDADATAGGVSAVGTGPGGGEGAAGGAGREGAASGAGSEGAAGGAGAAGGGGGIAAAGGSAGGAAGSGGGTDATDGELVTSLMSRMTDTAIARFVARDLIVHASPTDRLAQVFQTLVPGAEQQQRLLALTKEQVAASPLGSTEGFEQAWDAIAGKLLTSYSDKPFVTDEYARELSMARSRAVEVDELSEDPVERRSAWLGSVSSPAVRSLDLTLVLDLLRLEKSDELWGELMNPVVSLLDDFLLMGDFDAAIQIIGVLVAESKHGATRARQQHAMIGIDVLIAGSMMQHIVTHLATIDDAQFERVKDMCVSLGVVLVRPLAETLAVEDRPRTRERLTAILVAFGASARKTIERLKASQNPAVRKTAIYLMREFGGSESLPGLMELVDDNEPFVQREAVRAILNIGTDEAYKILEQALTSGTDRSRDAIMQAVSSLRDDRATPLFVYILRNVDHRGPLATVYVRAIDLLGSSKDSAGIPSLKEALYKGEWWRPGRTRTLRVAAAAALARIGTSDAWTVLEEAAASGLRGVRAAAKPHVTEWRRREARREAREGGS